MKKAVIICASVVFALIAVFGAYYADMNRMSQNLPVIFSTWGYDYASPESDGGAVNPDVQQSFVATVLKEDLTHMIVEPAADEAERKIAPKIKIDYQANHQDYFYGIGRKVVVYYTGEVDTTEQPVIYTDDISTEGFREFELSVNINNNKGKYKVLGSDDIDSYTSFGHISDTNLYYYNADGVNITVDGSTMPLDEALKKGKITLHGIIQKANSDAAEGTQRHIYA